MRTFLRALRASIVGAKPFYAHTLLGFTHDSILFDLSLYAQTHRVRAWRLVWPLARLTLPSPLSLSLIPQYDVCAAYAAARSRLGVRSAEPPMSPSGGAIPMTSLDTPLQSMLVPQNTSSQLLRTAAAGRAGIFGVFAGQGGAWLEEVKSVLELEPGVRPLLEAGARTLRDVAAHGQLRDQPALRLGYDVLGWLEAVRTLPYSSFNGATRACFPSRYHTCTH